jgi:hypothetical protein
MGLLDFFKKDECENHYKFGKTLGSGSFATVKLATKKDDNTQWAVKIINMSALGPEDDAMLENEVAVLNKVRRPAGRWRRVGAEGAVTRSNSKWTLGQRRRPARQRRAASVVGGGTQRQRAAKPALCPSIPGRSILAGHATKPRAPSFPSLSGFAPPPPLALTSTRHTRTCAQNR